MNILGVQRATVVTSNDPAGQGRVRLTIPAIFGTTTTDWVPASVENPKIPGPGKAVWVTFQDGNTDKPIYLASPPSPDLSPYALLTDSRFTNARTPTMHATTHQPGGTDAMVVDAVAATGSLRTLGTGSLQATAGNDTRLSDTRTPSNDADLVHKTATETLTSKNLSSTSNVLVHTVANAAARTALTAYFGMHVIEADTKREYVYDGVAWQVAADPGAYQTYTSQVAAAATVALSTNESRYQLVGKRCTGQFYVLAGGASASGTWWAALPLRPRPLAGKTYIGSGMIWTGAAYANGLLQDYPAANGGAAARINIDGGDGAYVGAMASGHEYMGTFDYEIA